MGIPTLDCSQVVPYSKQNLISKRKLPPALENERYRSRILYPFSIPCLCASSLAAQAHQRLFSSLSSPAISQYRLRGAIGVGSRAPPQETPLSSNSNSFATVNPFTGRR